MLFCLFLLKVAAYFQELVVAISGLVAQFEMQFAAVAYQMMEEEKQQQLANPIISGVTSGGWTLVSSPGRCSHLSLSLSLSLLVTSPVTLPHLSITLTDTCMYIKPV